MPDEYFQAFIGLSAAVVGAALSGIYGHAVRYITRPKLTLSFDGETPEYIVQSTYPVDGVSRTSKHVRVRVTNSGRQVAHNCRVFLTSIKKNIGGQLHNTNLYDAKELRWAGFPEDYHPRELPCGVNFYIDVLRISTDDAAWNFCFKTWFASQLEIREHKGTYQVTVVVTAESAKPTALKLNITYDGDYKNLVVARA